VDLDARHRTVRETRQGDSLHLPPSTSSVLPTKTIQIADLVPARDRRDADDPTDDLELHGVPCLRLVSRTRCLAHRLDDRENAGTQRFSVLQCRMESRRNQDHAEVQTRGVERSRS
jgi:hypothetical protein